MMQYRLMNRDTVVLFKTKQDAEKYRKEHASYKRRRIVEVVQLCPSQVVCGIEYRRYQ